MKMRSITRILAIALALVLAAGLAACGSNASKKSEYKGIKTDSPEWVANLDAAATADQMLIVAAFSETATDAWVSLHEKRPRQDQRRRCQNTDRRFPFQPRLRNCG